MSKTVKPSWSFPVLEAELASSTRATAKSHFLHAKKRNPGYD